jgi:hypothetical protein
MKAPEQNIEQRQASGKFVPLYYKAGFYKGVSEVEYFLFVGKDGSEIFIPSTSLSNQTVEELHQNMTNSR